MSCPGFVGTTHYTRTHVRGYTVRRRHAPGGPGGRPARTVTWAGLAEHPVELDGYGVIPAGAAREHFTAARWRTVVTDAAGAVTAVPRASSQATRYSVRSTSSSRWIS